MDMEKIDKALKVLEDLPSYACEYETEALDSGMREDLQLIREALEEAKKPADRSGPVIVKNEGIIVAVTWQDGEGRIEEVLAESCGYPDMKAREAQALETIQNLLGAFDKTTVGMTHSSNRARSAIKAGRAYIEQHKPEEDEDLGGLNGVGDSQVAASS